MERREPIALSEAFADWGPVPQRCRGCRRSVVNHWRRGAGRPIGECRLRGHGLGTVENAPRIGREPNQRVRLCTLPLVGCAPFGPQAEGDKNPRT